MNVLTCGRLRRRNCGLLEPVRSALMMRCDAPAYGATTRDGDEAVGAEVTSGVGGFLPSGTIEALPMPLGSESTLGLAGPNGTPLIGELPAPADPAGGVSCAKACPGTFRLPSAKARTSAEWRNIRFPPGAVQVHQLARPEAVPVSPSCRAPYAAPALSDR